MKGENRNKINYKNSSQPGLTQLTHDLGYEIEITL
jgi:hypothetical protein